MPPAPPQHGSPPIGRIGARVFLAREARRASLGRRGPDSAAAGGEGAHFSQFIAGLAAELGLGGFLRREPGGVWIEVEGGRITEFLARVRCEGPAAVRIEGLAWEALPPRREAAFRLEWDDALQPPSA